MAEPRPNLRVITVSPRLTPEDELEPVVRLAFARLHKSALGVACGAAGALLMGTITVVCLLVPSARDFPLGLLGEYFTGYDVSARGVFVGMGWGFVVAFVAGWFTAFARNFSLAVMAFLIRTRAEIDQTRTFLDHI